MKKIISALLICILLSCSVFPSMAAEKDADWYMENFFISFSDKLAHLTFKSISNHLDIKGIKYTAHISKNDWAEHEVKFGNGYKLYFMCFPLDSSYDSSEFGNPYKEKLTLMTLSYKDYSISVSDDLHCGTVKMSTHDEKRGIHNEDENMLSLISFYNEHMNGNISIEKALGVNVITGKDRERTLKSQVEERIEEKYWFVNFTSVSVAVNQGNSDPDDLNVELRLDYTDNAPKKKAAKEIAAFSDDLALTLYEKNDFIATLYIFWKTPNIYNDAVTYKSVYQEKNGSVYKVQEFSY